MPQRAETLERSQDLPPAVKGEAKPSSVYSISSMPYGRLERQIKHQLFKVYKEVQSGVDDKTKYLLQAEEEWILEEADILDIRIDPEAVYNSAQRIQVYQLNKNE